jgi:3-hydroxybutyryl-CoA dehydratase
MSESHPTFHFERHSITQEQIWRYAKVSGANDPIHVDPDSAKRSRFGGTVAQGLLLYAWISELMMQIDADAWSAGGQIEITFRAPAKPGDTINVCCRYLNCIERGSGIYDEYEVWCENQDQVRVIKGRALLPTRARRAHGS